MTKTIEAAINLYKVAVSTYGIDQAHDILIKRREQAARAWTDSDEIDGHNGPQSQMLAVFAAAAWVSDICLEVDGIVRVLDEYEPILADVAMVLIEESLTIAGEVNNLDGVVEAMKAWDEIADEYLQRRERDEL